ncbi:MAG: macro domain-containing protein [Lachnospiraceae bacterium]|nr:macro domain-containing protein [Lachnospiraceae bacterium]
MVKETFGDIRDATEDIICHQVNCQGVMGAGVAKALYQQWPNVKTHYQMLCHRISDPTKLLGEVQIVDVTPDKQVANVFGQLDFGRDPYRKYTDYVALTNAFNEIRNRYHDKSLAFPYGFGCGLANGDWNIVRDMIDTYFSDMDVTIYQLAPAAA